MTSLDRANWRARAGSTGAWIVVGVLVAFGYAAFVTRDTSADRLDAGRMFMLITGPLIMAGQIALASLLIRRYRIGARAWSVIAGGLTGLAIPVVLFLLFMKASEAGSTVWWHKWADGAVWAMLASGGALLGIGLLSGMALGYAASGED